MFQSSLQKQAKKFNKAVVPQHKDVEVLVSTLRVICVKWEQALCTFF